MKRTIVSILLCLSLAAGFAPCVAYEGEPTISQQTIDRAYILNGLGLFQGTETGFALERRATRIEGLVMLVRLLGEEPAVKAGAYPHAFWDVPTWGDAYVGYAVQKGLAKGTSDSTFGGTEYITANQYATFLLRALGYSDSAGDFTWSQAAAKAAELGVVSKEQLSKWDSQVFLRGDIVDLSYAALSAPMKSGQQTLCQALVVRGVFTEDAAKEAGVWTAAAQPPAVPSASPVPTATPSPAPTVTPAPAPEPSAAPEPASPVAQERAALAEGAYRLIPATGAGCDMDLVDHGRTAGTNVFVSLTTHDTSQRFNLLAEEGGFSLSPMNAKGMALDIAGQRAAGDNIQLWEANHGNNQIWFATQMTDGTYALRVSSYPDLAMAVSAPGSGGNVVLKTYDPADQSQRWTVEWWAEHRWETVPAAPEYDTQLISDRLSGLINGDYPAGKALGSDFVYDARNHTAWECYGFARLVAERVYGDTVEWRLTTTRTNTEVVAQLSRGQYSTDNVADLLNHAIPGDILQFDAPENHAMIYLWRDGTSFGVYDANWGAYNVVQVHSFAYSALQNKNSDHITLFRYTGYPTT